MTPVWPWHDSISVVLNSYFPSPFWEKNEFNEITLIFKMIKDAISFLVKWYMKCFIYWTADLKSSYFLSWTLKYKSNLNSMSWLNWIKWKYLFIFPSFADYFFLHKVFLKTGSLMNACESVLKLSNHDYKNVSEKCNLTFLQSFLSQ